MTDWLGGAHKTCAPVSLIPSFLPFLQASQLSPFPLDSSPSSFPLLGTHGPSCRASSRPRSSANQAPAWLPAAGKVSEREKKKKKSGGWAETRGGGSARGLVRAAGEYGQKAGSRRKEAEPGGAGGAGTEGAAVEQHRGRIAIEGARSARRSARQCYRRRAASSTGPGIPYMGSHCITADVLPGTVLHEVTLL